MDIPEPPNPMGLKERWLDLAGTNVSAIRSSRDQSKDVEIDQDLFLLGPAIGSEITLRGGK